MTVLQVSERPRTAPEADDGDLTHEVCCVDDDLTLCDRSASEMEWAEDDSPTTCVVCADLAKQFQDGEALPESLDEPACRICPRGRREVWP